MKEAGHAMRGRSKRVGHEVMTQPKISILQSVSSSPRSATRLILSAGKRSTALQVLVPSDQFKATKIFRP